jgi:hypothetical protein
VLSFVDADRACGREDRVIGERLNPDVAKLHDFVVVLEHERSGIRVFLVRAAFLVG